MATRWQTQQEASDCVYICLLDTSVDQKTSFVIKSLLICRLTGYVYTMLGWRTYMSLHNTFLCNLWTYTTQKSLCKF